MNISVKQRFYAKVALPDENGCMNWLAFITPSGYGHFRTRERQVRAHRYSYELHNGPIPEGKIVRHTCDNRACVAPDHLLVGTHGDNMTDRNGRGRTAKGEGHWASLLSEEQVLKIRVQYVPHKVTYRQLAEEYGVTATAIRLAVIGNTWKHLAKGEAA